MPIFEDAKGNLIFGKEVKPRQERAARLKRWKDSDPHIRKTIEWIANGGDLELWCRARDLPTARVREVLMSDRWRNDYDLAMKMRAYAVADRAERMLNDLANGLVDPKTADTHIKHSRWFAGVLNPDAFGEKRQVKHDHQHSVQVEHREAIRRLSVAREAEWQDRAAIADESPRGPGNMGTIYEHDAD